MVGGAGADVLSSGAGADSFVYLLPLDSAFGPRDLITDFSRAEEDVIDLADVFAGKLNFIGASSFTGAAGEVRVVAGGGGAQVVLVNIDGGEDAEMHILVDNATSLLKGDFIL